MKTYSPLSLAVSNLACALVWITLWTMCSYSIDDRRIVLFAFYTIMVTATGTSGMVFLFLHSQGYVRKSDSRIRGVVGIEDDRLSRQTSR